MKKRTLLVGSLMLCFCGVTGHAWAYTAPSTVNKVAPQATPKQVKGLVVDKDGPVIGATILIKNTQNGTITNVDGQFELNVEPGQTLIISYIGYKTQEVVYKGQSEIKVNLIEDTSNLEEVVVTGYGGTMRRTKVTNSIAKVNEDQLKVGVYSNPAQALSGAVAGMQVKTSSGRPDAQPQIVLRGGTNFDGSGSPLVVIDGQLRSFTDINPEDVESMTVLKDAGATALYGARASNGVILVTTKSGKQGHREINLKAKVGWNYLNNPYEFLSARDYITWQRRAYNTSSWANKAALSQAQPFGTGNKLDSNMLWNVMELNDTNKGLLDQGWLSMPDPLDPNKTIIYKETDLKRYNIKSPALTQDYNINMSGGNDKGSYYAGFGYNNTEGLPITSSYKRYNIVFNGSYKVTDWLTSTTRLNFSASQSNPMPGSQTDEGNYFGRILSVPPTARYVDEAGNLLLGTNASDGNQSYQPDKWLRDDDLTRFTISENLEARLMKNLWLNVSGQWYYSHNMLETFTKDFESTVGNWNRTRNTYAGYSQSLAQTYNATLKYMTTINDKHNIDALVGTEYYISKTKGFSASGSGAPTDAFADLEYTSAEANKRSIDSNHQRSRISSYFGRVNYDYLGKYLLSGVFRYDGYSSLLNHRWGFFPGVSAGWLFGNENFVKDAIPALSFGKLRASYGINGNASGIGAYTLQGSYSNMKYNGNTGFLIGSLMNPDLRWEKTATGEVGLDMSFFNNRLNTAVTYYNRLTTDKYADFTLPSTTGFSSIKNNNGKLRNFGWEFEFSGTILKTKEITWQAALNFAWNQNRVVALPADGLERNRQGGQEIYTGRELINPEPGQYYRDDAQGRHWETHFVGGLQEGREPGLLVGYVAEGIYKSADEIPSGRIIKTGNVNGKYIYAPDAYNALSAANKKKALMIEQGDVKWKDINGDNVIDQYDQVVIGNTTPRWSGGFNTTFKYKNFTLYARLDGAFGFRTYDGASAWFLGNMQGTYNGTKDVFKTWTPENPDASLPRYTWADQLGVGNFNRTSTLFAYRGDYISLRELSLSYSLPKSIAQKLFMQRLEVSVTGQNLGYIFAPPVANPESGAYGGGAYSGSGYPLPRTLILGLNVTF